MEFCGMKREIDRKCLNHACVHANAQSFDRCEFRVLVLTKRHVGSGNEIGPASSRILTDTKLQAQVVKSWTDSSYPESTSVDFRFSSINYVFGQNECEHLRQKVFYSRLVSPAAFEQPKLKRDPQQTLCKSINYKPHWWKLYSRRLSFFSVFVSSTVFQSMLDISLKRSKNHINACCILMPL